MRGRHSGRQIGFIDQIMTVCLYLFMCLFFQLFIYQYVYLYFCNCIYQHKNAQFLIHTQYTHTRPHIHLASVLSLTLLLLHSLFTLLLTLSVLEIVGCRSTSEYISNIHDIECICLYNRSNTNEQMHILASCKSNASV